MSEDELPVRLTKGEWKLQQARLNAESEASVRYPWGTGSVLFEKHKKRQRDAFVAGALWWRAVVAGEPANAARVARELRLEAAASSAEELS